MQALLTVMALWLSANGELPPIEEHPRIELVSSERMMEQRKERLASGNKEDTLYEKLGVTETGPDIHAYYGDAERTIYLPDTWTADSPAQVSLLVHELVHHVQNVSGANHPCPAAREKAAYRAQSQWLELMGTSLEAEFGIDAMTLLVRTNCMY